MKGKIVQRRGERQKKLSNKKKEKKDKNHVLYGEVCPPGGPDPAAFSVRLHDLQPAVVLP